MVNDYPQEHLLGYDVPMENRTARFAKHYARRFGHSLKLVRSEAGMTQAEVSERMTEAGYPMSRVMIAKTESATRPVSVEELAAFAAVLQVPVPFLIPGGLNESVAKVQQEALQNGLLLTEGVRASLDEISANLANEAERLRTRYAILERELSGVDPEEG